MLEIETQPEKRPFYKDNLFLIAVQYFVLLLLLILLYQTGIFSNPYFSFGPSDNLNFFHVKIDTWELWSAMVIIRVITVISQTMTGSIISPWIYTVFQNRAIPMDKIGCSKEKAMFTVNSYEVSQIINRIFDIWIVFTQVDLALIEGATSLLVFNLWTVHKWIEEKTIYQNSESTLQGAIAQFKKDLIERFCADVPMDSELHKEIEERLEQVKQDILRKIARENDFQVIHEHSEKFSGVRQRIMQ